MEYKDLTVLDLQELKKRGELTYVQLMEYYLDRIKKFNDKTNSIAELNDRALKEAQKKDESYHSEVSPLYGIPVLVKDNINTLGMKTTAGAVVLKDFYSNDDAFIIKQLKKAGAIIIGKTNLSEFANFISEESSNGFSALNGQVKNPYGEDLDVCGSSAGTGAAMATSLAPLGIGTETSGSILCPAMNNSLVGLKPSVGYVSREGIIPISPTQDVPGPMTRTVIDAAVLFNGMIGLDKQDQTTIFERPIDLDKVKESIFGMRLGYVKAQLFKSASDEEIKLIEEQLNVLRSLGAQIVEFEHQNKCQNATFDVLYHEFPKALNEYFESEKNAPVKTLKEVIEFNNVDPDNRIPYGQQTFEKSIEVSTTKSYQEAVESDKKFVEDYVNQIKEMELDALIYIGLYDTWLPAKGGLPSVIVPAGYIGKRPFGITFSGLKYSEERLLQIAYNFEKVTQHRVNPQL